MCSIGIFRYFETFFAKNYCQCVRILYFCHGAMLYQVCGSRGKMIGFFKEEY